MATRLSPILALVEGSKHPLGKHLLFLCPACKDLHRIPIECTDVVKSPYMWNGDAYFPTILNGPVIEFATDQKKFACRYEIHNGYVSFHDGSQHDLAGTTVKIPILPDFSIAVDKKGLVDFSVWVSAGKPLEFPA